MGRVVDAHHHVWDEPGLDRYPWMAGEALAPLRRRFGFAQLKPLMAAAGIDAAVTVQARTDLEETHELLALAAAEPGIAGVVGWVDLTDGRTGETLARLRERPGGDKLAGVRHPAHDEPDPDWLARPDVLRGAEQVAEAGLAMDLLVRTRELPAALRLVRALPGLRCVVDHLAKPPIATGDLSEWRRRMEPLAGRPQVACKLSGLVTEARWDAWGAEDLAPAVEDGEGRTAEKTRGGATMANGWDALRKSMQTRCARHSPRLDSLLYNGGTAAVLLATAVATFLPTTVDPAWLPRALSGFAAFWIGLERALNFGGRWRYHREMQVGYENVIDKIDLLTAWRAELPDEDAQRMRDEIIGDIDVLQKREADIPTGDAPPRPPK